MAHHSRQHRKTRRAINAPGHAHELTFSCYQRWPLLAADRTRRWLVDAIDHARHRHDFDLWAWVIMPEHVHLLIRPREYEYDMAAILRAIKQPVAQQATAYLRDHNPKWLERIRIKRPNGRTEHRFWQQGGGYDRNIVKPDYVHTAIEYFHANPVRRGLVNSPLEWEWSSARWYAGRADALLQMDTVGVL